MNAYEYQVSQDFIKAVDEMRHALRLYYEADALCVKLLKRAEDLVNKETLDEARILHLARVLQRAYRRKQRRWTRHAADYKTTESTS